MAGVRVIPTLLLKEGGLVKSVRFKNFRYVGDPINAVKIFNEKEVDEIVLLDISATPEGRGPNYNQLREIASEAFIPVGYGGGINYLDEIKTIIGLGIEKVIINSAAHHNKELIAQGARYVGSQSMVVSIDVKKDFFGRYRVYTDQGSRNTGMDPLTWAKTAEELGAGEILLTSIDRDGTFSGYDYDLIQLVSESVKIPVIASGGASSVDDFVLARDAGASAMAAGSLFVFQRPHHAVLISYPGQKELKEKLLQRNGAFKG